jgi:Yip1 domain
MNSIVGKFLSAWLHPWDTMANVREEGEAASIKSSMIFIVVMGLLAGLVSAIVGTVTPQQAVNGQLIPKAMMWLAVVIVPLASLLGSFLGTLILWAIVFGLLKGSLGQYKTTYRLLAVLAAFSPVSAILSAIPKVGPYLSIAVNVWAIIVMIQGVVIIMGTPPVRTWVSCLFVFGFLFLLGVLANVTARREFDSGGFSDLDGRLGGIPNEIDLTSDEAELNKQLQELSEKEKAAPTTNAADPKK